MPRPVRRHRVAARVPHVARQPRSASAQQPNQTQPNPTLTRSKVDTVGPKAPAPFDSETLLRDPHTQPTSPPARLKHPPHPLDGNHPIFKRTPRRSRLTSRRGSRNRLKVALRRHPLSAIPNRRQALHFRQSWPNLSHRPDNGATNSRPPCVPKIRSEAQPAIP